MWAPCRLCKVQRLGQGSLFAGGGDLAEAIPLRGQHKCANCFRILRLQTPNSFLRSVQQPRPLKMGHRGQPAIPDGPSHPAGSWADLLDAP